MHPQRIFLGNILMFIVMLVATLSGFGRRQPPVLTVERINIVDSTGALALVLSNGARLPGAMFEGREYPQSFVGRGRSAGMIFFNEAGDEVGGLIYEGAARDSGYRAFGHLSFDQWKQNQVVALQYQDNGRSRSAGLRVWDRPTNDLERQFALAQRMLETPAGPLRDSLDAERRRVRTEVEGKQRLFLGSDDRVAALELKDGMGRTRVKLSVDSAGTARLVFLDAEGKTAAVYPDPGN
jgi:hypothetical protein